MSAFKNIQTAIEESKFNFFVISNNEVHGFNTIEEAEQDEEWGNNTLEKMGINEKVELITREDAIAKYA